MKTTIFIVGILVALLFITTFSTIGLVSIRSELECDLDNIKEDVDYWEEEANIWRERYLNYNCPEPEIEIIKEYIYRNKTNTIWCNKTIYIDNAIYDINRDKKVDYKDACEVLYYLKHGLSFCENIVFNKYGNPYEKLYDVNRDGNISIKDVEDIWINCDT